VQFGRNTYGDVDSFLAPLEPTVPPIVYTNSQYMPRGCGFPAADETVYVPSPPDNNDNTSDDHSKVEREVFNTMLGLFIGTVCLLVVVAVGMGVYILRLQKRSYTLMQ